MRIRKRKIQASSDYRVFDGFTMDELEECCPNLFYDYFVDIRKEARRAFVSKNSDCAYVGAEDSNGDFFVYKTDDPDFGPGWFEVDFAEFNNYLK